MDVQDETWREEGSTWERIRWPGQKLLADTRYSDPQINAQEPHRQFLKQDPGHSTWRLTTLHLSGKSPYRLRHCQLLTSPWGHRQQPSALLPAPSVLSQLSPCPVLTGFSLVGVSVFSIIASEPLDFVVKGWAPCRNRTCLSPSPSLAVLHILPELPVPLEETPLEPRKLFLCIICQVFSLLKVVITTVLRLWLNF